MLKQLRPWVACNLGCEAASFTTTRSKLYKSKNTRCLASKSTLYWARVTEVRVKFNFTQANLVQRGASRTRTCVLPAAATPGVANFVAVVSSLSVLVIAVAGAAFLLSAIPVLYAMARTALRVEALLKQVEREMPETFATLRLSGLEATDCMSQLSTLTSEVTSGVTSAAKLATLVQTGVQDGLGQTSKIIPILSKQEDAVRGALEAGLKARAQLQYNVEVVSRIKKVASATLIGVKVAQVVHFARTTALRRPR